MAKMGAPTKYKDEYTELAYNYCLLGATDENLADFFGVSESTINNWKAVQPDFVESIKRGKQQADAKVAQSLFHRATGYSHPETKIATTEGKITDSQEFDKHYAPDPTAAIFWLKNRQPALWRDRQQTEHSGYVHQVNHNPKDYTEAQKLLKSEFKDLD